MQIFVFFERESGICINANSKYIKNWTNQKPNMVNLESQVWQNKTASIFLLLTNCKIFTDPIKNITFNWCGQFPFCCILIKGHFWDLPSKLRFWYQKKAHICLNFCAEFQANVMLRSKDMSVKVVNYLKCRIQNV